MYRKREGTSGIRGQLYETKLISLLYLRAFYDNDIKEFHLASNIENIGALDDICLKAKVKGHNKPVAIFIQAKHKDKKNQKLEKDLTKYFDSYLEIRNAFNPTNDDIFFRGAFDQTECLFVIYTNAQVDFGDKLNDTNFSSHLYDLIGTGDDKADQKQVNDVSSLQEALVNHRVTLLAKRVAQFICKSVCNDSNDLQNILNDEIIQSYHVLLAQKVFDVSGIHPTRVETELCNGKEKNKEYPPYRIAIFRHDFIHTNDKHLSLFKDILLKEILRERKIKPADVETLLSDFLAKPTDAIRLSKVIGTVVAYNKDQLDYRVPKQMKNTPTNVCVSRSTVQEAVELAATEMFLSREFKVPAAFGNKDLTIRGSDAKVQKRINYLTSRMTDKLKNCDSSKMATFDESFDEGFLQLNGGLAGAIGNIFVIDGDSKLMKITENKESLEDLAKKLYEGLNKEIPNLLKYRFCFATSKIPKLSFNFEISEYETNLARDFLNKLIFYSNQGNENSVEEILKREITDNSDEDQQHCFQATNDALFVKYHDEIQKWWKQSEQAPYLTRESNLLLNAKNNIIKDPMMTSINAVYLSQIKKFHYSFSKDAVIMSLNLQEQQSNTVIIIAEISLLTVVKVMQHLKSKDYVVLNFEYIVSLPTRERYALRAELEKPNENTHLVFVCDNIRRTTKEKQIIENFAEAIKGKKTIVVTNNINTLEIMKTYFPRADCICDEKNSLIDMSEESQNNILETATVMFQGNEVKFDSIIDHESMVLVKGVVVNNIVTERIIEIGKSIDNNKYVKIKPFYVDRRLKNTSKENMSLFLPSELSLLPKTLNTTPEMSNNVVLVTAEPGMGKSTLLTHLSLKTKELEPETWIVRVNLLEYSREFSKWKEEHTNIDSLETLKFMCKVIVREKLGNDNDVEFVLEKENDAVSLKHCTGDQWTEFELKLFVHFFCKRKMILLFDGFDEICPHYKDEVIQCLKNVSSHPSKHRIWITSRPYNEVKIILEQEFGPSYEILPFLKKEMEEYLITFWKSNLSIKKLSSLQLENVKKFLDSMADMDKRSIAEPIYDVIKMAACYFCSGIQSVHSSFWPYTTNYSWIWGKCFYRGRFLPCDLNPLYLYHTAVDIKNNIKQTNKNPVEWYAKFDTYTVYIRYLKTKIEKQFRKAGIDICNPAVVTDLEKKHADSVEMHKKLGAYAIFNQHSYRLFKVKELDEIKEIIKVIGKGAEKTSLIDTVANEIPIFIHMSFAEYFAVEYICECLKNENICSEEFIEFTFSLIFSNVHFENIRKIFDNKIIIDKTLSRIMKNSKKVIFAFIMKQRVNSKPTALSDTVNENLNNLRSLFIDTLKDNIDSSNVNDFLEIVDQSDLFLDEVIKEYIILVLDVVKKYDECKLTSVLCRHFGFLPDYEISSCIEKTSEEIHELIRVYKYRYIVTSSISICKMLP